MGLLPIVQSYYIYCSIATTIAIGVVWYFSLAFYLIFIFRNGKDKDLANTGSEDLPMISLKDIVPAASNTINTQFILVEKGNINIDDNGKETTCITLAADETASLHFQLWGNECRFFEPGDIIRLTNGIFSYQKGSLVLRAGKKGKAEKVGEFNMLFVETPNMSEIKWGNDPSNSRKFVQEAVISTHSRIFPPLP